MKNRVPCGGRGRKHCGAGVHEGDEDHASLT